AVEAEAGIEDSALAVEGDRRIAPGFVRASDQVLDTWDQRPDVVWIAVGTAPRRAAVVREVRSRVGVGQSATRSPADRAGPCAGRVVVRRAHDTVRIVRVDAIAVSFCEAAAVSLLTVTLGEATLVPSSGL